ncbi:MAG: B12-binding domain-containing radical SAM protein [Elusimicrobia bacterium]|nr:B12-binding domain-containing radical SAM protein [Elusimicrobiota bacterium]
MAQIILFRPSASHRLIKRSPLGLIYVATPLLRKGYTVKLIDQGTAIDWQEELRANLGPETICAGVSVMTGSSITAGLEFSEFLKKNSKVPVVWGGIHPSLLPGQTLLDPRVDAVVVGEGEKKFADLVECYKTGGSPDRVRGIGFKKDGAPVFTPDASPLVMDELPVPDFGLVDIEYYIREAGENYGGRRCLDLNVDRGCPYRCAFCYNIKFNERKWRAMSAGRILEIIEALKARYRLGAINFVSDNFFVDKKRAEAVCRGLVDRGLDLKWHSDIRIDTFLQYDDAGLELIKKSGCDNLTFGVESGSDPVLKKIDKDITVAQVLQAHKRVAAAGFKANYHFMLGFPEETREDILETVRIAAILTEDPDTNVYGPSMYIPYPGAPLFDKCVKLGFAPPARLEDWGAFDWEETSKLPWFTGEDKSFMNEVQTLARGAFHNNLRARFATSLVYFYCRLRLWGLRRGLTLRDLDTGLMRRFRDRRRAA